MVLCCTWYEYLMVLQATRRDLVPCYVVTMLPWYEYGRIGASYSVRLVAQSMR